MSGIDRRKFLWEPFDLVAPGGPDNVWITEVGTDFDARTRSVRKRWPTRYREPEK